MIVSPFRLPKISCASRTPLATPRAWQDISEGQVPSAGRRPGHGDPHEWAPYSGRQESPPCQLQTNRKAWDAAADLIEPGRCPTFLAPRWGPDGARDSLGSFYQGGAHLRPGGLRRACPSLVYRHALGVAYSVSILQVGQSVSSTLLRYTVSFSNHMPSVCGAKQVQA